MVCPDNTFRVTASNVVNEGQVNTCGTCRACVDGVDYESTSCTSVRNRVCTACTRTCAAGQYKSSPCIVTRNTQCTACATKCNAGSYKTAAAVCDGSKTYDSFLAGCAPCKQPGDCLPGYYISKACLGTDTSSNQCLLCSAVPATGDCPATQYRGGCYNYTNTICVPFTTCTAGQYLAGESRVQDGVCTTCTNCAALSLIALRACSTYDDAVCKGASCNRSVPCVTPAALESRGRLACDYSSGVESSAFCGMCPRGYGSDGQFCQECPTGKTCNRLGIVECKGKCDAGVIGSCDGGLMGGYVDCTSSGVSRCSTTGATGVGGRYVTRGPYVRAESTDCDVYFDCGPGYYKIFRSTGVAECNACPVDLLPHRGVLDRWVTGGLSVGDQKSCLWECKQGVAIFNASRGGCVLLTGRSNAVGTNLAGWWASLQTSSGIKEQCPYGRTSEPLMAASASDCLMCPPLPSGATLHPELSKAATCDWVCTAYGTEARGGACVSPVQVCAGVRGYVRRSTTSVAAGCIGTSFPWNRGGYAKTGWATPRIVRTDSQGGMVVRAQSGLVQDGIVATSLRYGVSGRHSVSVDGFGTARSVEGSLCSATRVRVGAYDFVVGAVCNESFLAYLNLSDTRKGLGVLIGVPGTRGFRNGFRREALFGSELYVASGRPMSNVNGSWTPSIFVLDRWNCLMREVVIYGEPGGYLTRAYTVAGDDANLAKDVKKCSGPNALSWPRKFWALGNDWLVFADEVGLWQFHVVRRELLLMVQETTGGFEADDLLDVDLDGDEFTLRLIFNGNITWYISALQDRCPDDYTSMDGGDCMMECRWMSGGGVPSRFVNQSGGGCTPCSTLQCDFGEVFQLCTRLSDSVCSPCPSLEDSGWVYSAVGTCDATSWKRAPPCEPGYYSDVSGRFCEMCPAFSATRLAGATHIRQCKCVPGLVRRGGRCVGTEMFEFEGVVAGQPLACAAKDAAGGCVAPRNGNITSTEKDVACKWECNVGFYRDTGAGWEDQCRPCMGPVNIAVGTVTWTSRGDDDARRSCEWISG